MAEIISASIDIPPGWRMVEINSPVTVEKGEVVRWVGFIRPRPKRRWWRK